mmetsp:Transcript_28756/g.42715  ORF Transcript_28756/g.42715 Transcript_28756/m.42715 type:complete len:106 (+) Transcript_28756:631-948(+)
MKAFSIWSNHSSDSNAAEYQNLGNTKKRQYMKIGSTTYRCTTLMTLGLRRIELSGELMQIWSICKNMLLNSSVNITTAPNRLKPENIYAPKMRQRVMKCSTNGRR